MKSNKCTFIRTCEHSRMSRKQIINVKNKTSVAFFSYFSKAEKSYVIIYIIKIVAEKRYIIEMVLFDICIPIYIIMSLKKSGSCQWNQNLGY